MARSVEARREMLREAILAADCTRRSDNCYGPVENRECTFVEEGNEGRIVRKLGSDMSPSSMA